ncbi:hypothetical protein LguiA_006283 [Lonicera macranthoides]
MPTESSRTSFSSSCSSAFSSVECNKKPHPEPPSLSQCIFPENPSPNFPGKQTNSALHSWSQSPDKRDLVKDSMYREARGVSIKTVAKEERNGRAMKHIDSPRPLLQSKPVQPRVTGDGLVFASSLTLGTEDAPRYSYDGRVSQYSLKSTIMIKELPKLSLDSRERSIRSSAAESRSNYLLTDIKRENGDLNQILNQKPGSNKRPSSVVARLMGLETFPNSSSPDEDLNSFSRFDDERKQNQVSRSRTVTHKDPISNSTFPLEPAPWGSQTSAFRYAENRTEVPQAAPSVYSEIEKRLTELEFKKSGKDPRALKQILETMQKTRKRLEEEEEEEEQTSNVKCQTSKYRLKYGRFQQSQQSNDSFSPTTKGSGPPRRDGSPIMIQKSAKDLTPRSSNLKNPSGQPLNLMDKKKKGRTLIAPPSSKVPQHVGENPTSFRRISGMVSPRLQQTKNGREKQCCPTTPPSDLRRARRQPSKQPIESGSPSRKLKPKSRNLSGESRNLSHRIETVSVQSKSNISFVSQLDTKVATIYPSKDLKDKNYEGRLTEDESIAELATTTLEQPSPVSVLDATFYGEGSPSPVRKVSNSFEDDETAHYHEAEWGTLDINCLLNSTRPSLGSKFKKHSVHMLRLANSSDDDVNIDHIACLCYTNPDHRYIAEILLASGLLEDQCFSWSTIQLHPAGHFINPNLFHVLEKTRGNTELANDEQNRNIAESKSIEKTRRKLVFDAVNEIIGHKLAFAGSSLVSKKLERRSLSGEKLLKELWSEMDNLQSKEDCSVDDEVDDGLTRILSAEMMNQSNDWTDYPAEFSGLVLDIERLIFKDLISEVVNGQAADLQHRTGSHRRQLFSK